MKITYVTNEQELELCFQVRKEVFVEEQQVPLDLEMDEYDVFPLVCGHILLTDQEIPIGTARLKSYDGHTAKFQRIAVTKDYRGKGAGKRLLDALEARSIELGYTSAILDAQVQAEPFYVKSGFRTVSLETFLDAGIPHVRMEKNL